MAPAVVLGCLNQPFDLPLGEVLAGPIRGIGLAYRQGNCAFFGGWTDHFQVPNCLHIALPMSGLSGRPTLMSALPPKADIRPRDQDVCFGSRTHALQQKRRYPDYVWCAFARMSRRLLQALGRPDSVEIIEFRNRPGACWQGHRRNSESQGVVPHADKKRVTIERHCCRESHLDAEEMTVSRRIAAGETGREPAPKEQPPRKLSGR